MTACTSAVFRTLLLRTTSFVLAIGALTCASADPAQQSAVENGLLPLTAYRDRLDVRATIEDRMRAYGVPGLSIAVIDDGHIAWAQGYGVTGGSSRRPVTTMTLFQAASISKPIAALVALQLVERSKLQLDTDVDASLTSWKIPENAFTARQKVTLRRLLTHTAGLTDIDIPGVPIGEPVSTLRQFLSGAATTPAITVESMPGGEPQYSGSGYAVLQQVLEDTGRQPFDVLAAKSVFQTLAMKRSTFQHDPMRMFGGDIALGHYAGGADVNGGYRQYAVAAAAGLWTTPTDLARYVIAVQHAYAGVSGAIVGRRLTQQLLNAEEGRSAFGLVITGSRASARFGHDGFNEGYESTMVGYLQGERGAVVMTNSSFAFPLVREVVESIARVYRWPDYPLLGQQVVSDVPAMLVQASVGRYVPREGAPVDVISKAGHLLLGFPEGVAEVMAAPDGRLFSIQLMYSDYGSPWLEFKRNAEGAYSLLLGDAGEYVLTKTD